MAEELQTVKVRIVPREGVPVPRAEVANWFALSHVAGDVQLQMGYLDVAAMADMIGSAKRGELKEAPTVYPEITHRIFMSAGAFLILRAHVDEIYRKMVEADVLNDSAPEVEIETR